MKIVKPMYNIEFCRYYNRIHVTSDESLSHTSFGSDNIVDFLDPTKVGFNRRFKRMSIKVIDVFVSLVVKCIIHVRSSSVIFCYFSDLWLQRFLLRNINLRKEKLGITQAAINQYPFETWI